MSDGSCLRCSTDADSGRADCDAASLSVPPSRDTVRSSADPASAPYGADVDNLARLHRLRRFSNPIEDRQPRGDDVAFYANDNESQPKSRQIALVLDLSVNCHKNIESTLGIGKELFVLAPLPSDFAYCPNGMIRKRRTHPRVDALV